MAENEANAFIDRQIEFAAHLRDPDNKPAPADVEDRRMQIYRDLFFNNVSSFLANAFRTLRSCMDDAAWDALIRDFYRDHASRSPLFTKLSKEFVTYLSEERQPQPGDLPFMSELAHFEWVDVELIMSPDPQIDAAIDRDGDLLDGRPLLSPLAWGLSYTYPVNEIDENNQPTAPADAPLHFIVYRNTDDDVKFVKLNVVSARLFALIDTDPTLTGRDALNTIATELGHQKPKVVVDGGLDILRQWHDLGIVLGTRTD
ncbi:MAG: DNA-binding domain-containing protein [Gammaproteobacteria bacterium]